MTVSSKWILIVASINLMLLSPRAWAQSADSSSSRGIEPSRVIPNSKAPEKHDRLDKDLVMYRAIQDDARFPWADPNPRDDILRETDEMESRAYDEVIQFARQSSVSELEKNARHDVMYRDLMLPGRLTYKLELVYLEGRLRRIRETEPSSVLREAGIEHVYELWMFPKDEVNPVCIFVTDLPSGLSPQREFNNDAPSPWIGVAGYYFKLLQYDSSEADPNRPGKLKVRRAPVLISRSVRMATDIAATDGGLSWRQTFMPLVVFGFAALALILTGLAFWFRRGDRHVKSILENTRAHNPFDPSAPDSDSHTVL